MKYFSIYPSWFCKKKGGLFLGLSIDFPTRMFLPAENRSYACMRFSFGLLLFGIIIDIKFKHKDPAYNI